METEPSATVDDDRMESDLVPYHSVHSLPARQVLVLAPHPDDEVFGCAGAICRHVSDAVPLSVIVLTAGEAGGDPQVREQECLAAAQILGYGRPEFWRLPDRALAADDALVQRLARWIDDHGVDLVYAPSLWEIHPDHRQASLLALEAVRRARPSPRLAWYEIGSPLRPNQLLDITDVWPLKRRAIQCFGSQTARQDYLRHIASLNEYRTYTLGPQARQAEAYCLWSADEVHRRLPEAVSPSVSTLRPLPTALPGRKVSVLVRSVNRDSLQEALDSIAVQTHPDIEVVVVAAVPGHRPLPDHCGAHPMRLLETDEPLARSRCANKALAHAAGDLLLFLDDDDWLLPSHIERLVNVLGRLPGQQVAYTGIALVDEAGNPLGQVFDVPFDNMRLLSGNLMPLHAVLFSRHLVERGCRFDERLDLYEDWDFWIQLSRHAVFAHLPGISAVYRIHASSGIHREPGPLGAPAQQIYGKWNDALDPEDKGRLMRIVWSHAILEEEIIGLRQALQSCEIREADILQRVASAHAELEDVVAGDDPPRLERVRATLADLGAPPPPSPQTALIEQLEYLQHENAALRASTSWRMTAPLRALVHGVQAARRRLPTPWLRRVLGVLRREGWAGVMARTRRSSLQPPSLAPDYATWCRQQALRDAVPLAQARERLRQAASPPVISVLMPVYNPPLLFLDEAIRSVVSQHYTRWELCIADDASPDPAVMERLRWWTQQDSRIKVVGRTQNGHISEASNSALTVVQGDFIALLDNDDVLSADALTWVADTILSHPDVQIIYSDEDKMDSAGQRFGPYFKSDWNHSLFLGHNLISHLGVYRTALVREVGGFRKGFEGSQDYDLALRCIERIRPNQIVHIPRFLYHWRTLPGSTALGADEKPYALTSGQRALQEHLSRVWPGARTEILPTWNYRCVPPPLPSQPVLTLILLGAERAADWVDALGASLPIAEVQTCADEAFAVARAVERAGTEFVALLDARFEPLEGNPLAEMLALATRSDVAIVGGSVYDGTERLFDGGLVLNRDSIAVPLHEGLPIANNGYMGRALLTQELSAVSLRCAVFRRAPVLETGVLYAAASIDAAASAECGLELAAKGWVSVWSPRSRWRFPGGRTPDQPRTPRTDAHAERIRQRHGERLRADPAYHTALDATRADFSLRADGSGPDQPA